MFIGVFVNAQILDPVIWEFSQTKISESEVELQFKASIEDHWHLYSQFTGQFYGDEGPIPTSFVFKESENYEKLGETLEEIPMEVFDPIFEMDLKYFEGLATFSQKIKTLNSNPFIIEGEINFMSCDQAQCIFPMPVPFSFHINSDWSIIAEKVEEEITIEELVKIVGDLMSYSGEYVSAPTYPGSVSRRCPDITKSKERLNYSPKVPWKKGLKETVSWYTDFYSSSKQIYSGGFKPPEELSYQGK